jgi:GntR family transcriptional repressor for pyruvate dehydrogenase complex
MAAFSAIAKTTQVSKLVEAQIEEAIMSRRFEPGSKLPTENALCQQFGVSRTAVREALRMLSARGLIRINKGKGIFVQQISADTVTAPLQLFLTLTSDRHHVLDIVHARQIIEPPIAASAAVHHTEEDARQLERDHRALEASTNDFIQLAHLDMVFHLSIARASENSIIPLILEPIHRLLPQIKSSVYASVSDAKDSAVIWHRRILDAILRRDAEGARKAMEEHLLIAEEHAKQMLAAKEEERRATVKN